MSAMMMQMSLREIVKKCVESGITDPVKIARRVDVRNAGEELIQELVREAVTSLASQEQKFIRNGWKAESVRPSAVNAENAARSAQARVTRMFDTWIVSGTPLGRCDKIALSEAATFERGCARGHEVNAAFYEALADRVKAKKTVAESMTEKEAVEILSKVQAA